jgi:hypothetical protein
MSGNALPDLELFNLSPDISNNSQHYVLDIGFVNDLGYDIISYNFDTSGTTYQENITQDTAINTLEHLPHDCISEHLALTL